MGTDKTQFYETRNQVPLLSVLVVPFVVKILFLTAGEQVCVERF